MKGVRHILIKPMGLRSVTWLACSRSLEHVCCNLSALILFYFARQYANKKKTCYNHTSITLVKRKTYLCLCVSYQMNFFSFHPSLSTTYFHKATLCLIGASCCRQRWTIRLTLGQLTSGVNHVSIPISCWFCQNSHSFLDLFLLIFLLIISYTMWII